MNKGKDRAERILKSAGYKAGGACTVAAVKKAVHKHEKHDHPGKPLTKLKDGGKAPGHKGHKRGDKKSRVNIIIAPHGGDQKPPMPMPMPPMGAKPPMPMPPAPMPPAGGPAGAPPMQPPMKKGGRVGKYANGGKVADVHVGLTGGAGGGMGRLEKAKAARKHGVKPR